jgi:hypothetical protein
VHCGTLLPGILPGTYSPAPSQRPLVYQQHRPASLLYLGLRRPSYDTRPYLQCTPVPTDSDMTTVLAIQPGPMPRTTPVPIAAARPRKQQKLSPAKENPTAGKPTSTNGSVSNTRSRRERPCDACRRRKSRCVIHEGAALCVLCEFHKQECTFVQSPLPRKRKVVDGDKKDSPNVSKKRYV